MILYRLPCAALLAIFLSWSTANVAQAQTLEMINLAPLPGQLIESSGLSAHDDGTFWSHEDSGNAPQLVRIDTLGQVIQILTIEATNVDWEELTKDQDGNLFIGDFGNNANSRTDLRVYRVDASLLESIGSVSVDTIRFTYGDQNGFPPISAHRHFDMEAMVWWNDTLHLFSKDRSSPHLGITKRYKLPALSGTHIIYPVDTFYTGQTNNIFSITGAGLSENGDRLVLINANSIWMFTDFTSTEFFNGAVSHLHLGTITQKEAVCFRGDMLYITDERSPLSDGHLYRVNPALFVSADADLIRKTDLKAIYASDGRLESIRWESDVFDHWTLHASDGARLAIGKLDHGCRSISSDQFPRNSSHAVITLYSSHGKKAAILIALGG
jgi:hypothetical protein